MKTDTKKILAVPTNIITGFLGVGKTTAILHLLTQKPANERWAILVNEFGEIGVDGSLIKGNKTEGDGVFIREVPGGCMCCTAGLPMQIALNQLLTRAKPDRLIIEPTGLGHPKEVLEVLSAEHYQSVITIQQCITLVDGRKVTDTRYNNHDTFNQQIDMADIIVGHKSDLYDDKTQQNLIDYVGTRRNPSVKIIFAKQGNIDITILNGKSHVVKGLKSHQHNHPVNVSPSINDQPIPECGFLKVDNKGEGFKSEGWRFSPKKVFDRTALFSWLSGLKVERAKGVFITHEGIFGYNLTTDTLTEMALDDCIESRIEVLSYNDKPLDQAGLMACIEASL